MDFIVLKGNEKLIPPHELNDNRQLIQSDDAFVDEENKICIIQCLTYLTIPKDEQTFEEYLENQFLTDIRDALNSDDESSNEILNLHYEYFEMPISEIAPKERKIQLNTSNKSPKKIARLFVFIEVGNCSNSLMKKADEFENSFANMLKKDYFDYLDEIMEMPIASASLDSLSIYELALHIKSDDWEYNIPDVSLIFDPNDFQNSLDVFRKEVGSSLEDENLLYKVELNEPDQEFSIILLHPFEAMKILDSPLGALNPKIEEYANGNEISEEDLDVMLMKYKLYNPYIRDLSKKQITKSLI